MFVWTILVDSIEISTHLNACVVQIQEELRCCLVSVQVNVRIRDVFIGLWILRHILVLIRSVKILHIAPGLMKEIHSVCTCPNLIEHKFKTVAFPDLKLSRNNPVFTM